MTGHWETGPLGHFCLLRWFESSIHIFRQDNKPVLLAGPYELGPAAGWIYPPIFGFSWEKGKCVYSINQLTRKATKLQCKRRFHCVSGECCNNEDVAAYYTEACQTHATGQTGQFVAVRVSSLTATGLWEARMCDVSVGRGWRLRWRIKEDR